MADSALLVGVLERFAATLAKPFEINDVLYELGDTAVAVLDAAGAGVSVADREGRLLFVTATSEVVIEIERVQERLQAGPCVESFTSGEVVAVNEISRLGKWNEYQATAARCDFQSVVGLPLSAGDFRFGSLNVYDTRIRKWSPEDLRLSRVLADIATAYILRAGELSEAKLLSEQLQRALDSRVVIEQAKGMLARDHQLPVEQAFELLRNHSRRNNTPIRQLAEAVVDLGMQLPPPSRG